MLKSIRIENPVSDCRFTNKNRAKRFVAQGRAVWVEPGASIRFIAADHRHRAAQASVDTTRFGYERAAHAGLAQLSELANLPMVTPGVLLGSGKRKGASRHTFLANRGLVSADADQASHQPRIPGQDSHPATAVRGARPGEGRHALR